MLIRIVALTILWLTAMASFSQDMPAVNDKELIALARKTRPAEAQIANINARESDLQSQYTSLEQQKSQLLSTVQAAIDDTLDNAKIDKDEYTINLVTLQTVVKPKPASTTTPITPPAAK